ncbi:MAG: response regulator [Anaerolineae bacterium]|nr:response regulator [Anaerolineae bacterium]
MTEAPLPTNERARLAALRALHILDTPPEERFDRITRIATRLFDVPIAVVTLVDVNRQWFKSCIGLPDDETPRSISFCAHAILNDDVFVIPDATLDPRFRDNPLVTDEPYIRFYAGQPLKGPGGHNIGTLCVIDRRPRTLSSADRQSLVDLAQWAENELNSVELNEALVIQRESEARIRAIMDATSEAILLVNPDRYLVALNHRFSELFAVTAEDVLGHKFEDLQSYVERIFADPAALRARLNGTAADARTTFTEFLVQTWPAPRELKLYSTPVRTSDGRYLGRLYVFSDVTREREVDRMKTEFVSVVSHELRTPLTSIKGFTDLMLDGDAGPLNDEQEEYLAIIKRNADRLVALINDLLDISRIESGRVQLALQAVDLGAVVQEVAETLRPQIEAKSQTLSVDVPADLPPVLADRDRLVQIVTNLLSNAYKYTLAGGRLAIAATHTDGVARLAVSDTGAGIAPEDQAKLFTPFHRVDSSLTREVGGTGLGLSIVKSLVELHGGHIEVTSQVGVGSTFSFTLPFAPVTSSAEVTRPVAGPPGAPLTPATQTILVVEDDPSIAQLIRLHLERVGYTVVTAGSAEEALDITRTQPPDLITLDLQLPGMDGLSLAEILAAADDTRHIPILVVSAFHDAVNGPQLGMVKALPKPIDQEQLVATVARLLHASQRRRILVVEDTADIADLLKRTLEAHGFEVRLAADGIQALDQVQREEFGLLLLDLRLPGIDGFTVLETLKRDPATADIPVIVMTGSESLKTGARARVLALGAADFVTKPFDLAALVEEIQTLTGEE